MGTICPLMILWHLLNNGTTRCLKNTKAFLYKLPKQIHITELKEKVRELGIITFIV